jgi:hypothetical protein
MLEVDARVPISPPGRAAGHDVSVLSRSTRVRTADEKLEGFRRRARRAVAARR